jgi:DNA-binding MarR family transcriptional regulator
MAEWLTLASAIVFFSAEVDLRGEQGFVIAPFSFSGIMVASLFRVVRMDQADSFREMRDWIDAAAVFDRAVRVFADNVRPVVAGTKAARLSPSNIILLTCLERIGRARIADVMRTFRLQPSNSSYSLKALAEAGCVSLEKDPENRRSKIVAITDYGIEIARAVRARCAADQRPEAVRKLRTCLEAADIFEEGIELASVLAEPARPAMGPAPVSPVKPGSASSKEAGKPAAAPTAAKPSGDADQQSKTGSVGDGAAATTTAKPALPRRPAVRLPLARSATSAGR